MRKLRIGFSRNRKGKIFSVLLQKYMRKPYSHCFIEFETMSHLGDNAIYHSNLSAGIGYMSKTVFEQTNEIISTYDIYLDDIIYDNMKRQLFSVCGKSYGLSQNLGILFVDMFSKFLIRIKNPFIKGENCSEMLFRHCINVISADYVKKYDPNTIKPSDIEDIVKVLGKISTI